MGKIGGAKRKRTTKQTEDGNPPAQEQRKLATSDFRGEGMERYEKIFSHRSIIVERKVVLEHFTIASFRFQIIDRGWAPILAVAEDVFEEAVREFYSNFEVTNAAEFKASVFWRGKKVQFSAASIASLVGLPREPNPEFTLKNSEEVLPDLNVVARDICGEPQDWPPKGKKMKQSCLTDDNRMVNLIVCACINPGGHTNEIRPEVGRFIYALNNNMRIDLPSYIFEVVEAAAKSKKKNEGLPFSSLITKFARKSKVTLRLQDVVKYVGGAINKTTYNKSLVQTKNARKRLSADPRQILDGDCEANKISMPPTLGPGEATLDALYAALIHGMRGLIHIDNTLSTLDQKLTTMDIEISNIKSDMNHILQDFDTETVGDNGHTLKDCDDM